MLINEIINSLLLPTGKENDLLAREVSRQQIISLYATLVKREHDKTKIIPQSLIQKIKCVSLNKTSEYACGDLGKGFVLETNKIPKVISLRNTTPFVSVFIDFKNRKRREFGYITPEELQFLEYRPFVENSFLYTYEDDKIIIPQFKYEYQSISIRGLFSNPELAKEFSKEEAVKCGCCETVGDDECEENEESSCFTNGEFDINDEIASLILSMYGQNKSNGADNSD